VNGIKLNSETGELEITGPVTFSTTPELHRRSEQLMQSLKTCVINFKNVTQVDSSAVALFLAWKKKSKSICSVHVPSYLQDLVHTYGLDQQEMFGRHG